ncbi:zinc ribbon domain-containing protein, partial [Streptomyces durbertensis]
MSTAIAVTCAGLQLDATEPHTPAAHVLTPPGEQTLDDALSTMRMLLDQHGYVIALYSTAVDPAARQRLHTVRSVLESDRVALVRSDLPPLGLAVLVRQLRQLSTADLSPGVLAGAVRLLAHYVHAGALLGSVARLGRLPVPLRAHARSWLPGGRFGVLAAPVPQLVRIGGEATLEGPAYATRLTVATGQLNGDWVTGELADQWRVASLEPASPPTESSRWWGTGRFVEFAAAIPDVSMLYQIVCSVRRATCHWCGLELIGDRCVFCQAPVPP